MSGVVDAVSSIVSPKDGPGLLRRSKTADNPMFALAGNMLGFGRDLLPSAGLLENRSGFEWEMGCMSWQSPKLVDAEALDAAKLREDRDWVERMHNAGVNVSANTVRPGAETAIGKSQEWAQPEPKSIKFRVNPSNVSWAMRQRSVEQKSKAGTVLHVWNDNMRKTYFDEPVLTIKFESGNILPARGAFGTPGSIPQGLNNFYEFLSLVDEVKVLDDGRANLCYINYNSLVFPQITLWGFWTPNGVSFVDNATNHAQVNSWTAAFTVYRSNPEIGRAIETINQSIVDGSLAGESLKKVYNERISWTYANKRSETFGVLEDITGTAQGLISGQISPRDAASASKATIEAASQRIVSRASTALAGAVGAAVSGVPNTPRASGGGMNA